jgi:hypothetical protein
MRRRAAVVCLSLVLLLAGCGAGARGDQTFTARNEDGEKMTCHQEYPTGSHIGRTVCRTDEQIAEERLKSREFVNRPPVKLPVRRESAPPAGP